MLGLWLNITTHRMILLPYQFCGDSHRAFAFPFVLIFLPLRLSCKESSTSNQAFLLRRKDVTALLGARNRYAIRLAGHQSPRHGCAGWDRLDITCYYLAKGTGYYSYFKTTLFCNKSQRERNVFYV